MVVEVRPHGAVVCETSIGWVCLRASRNWAINALGGRRAHSRSPLLLVLRWRRCKLRFLCLWSLALLLLWRVWGGGRALQPTVACH